MVLDELLRVVQTGALVNDLLVAQIFEHAVVDREAMPVEGEEHHVGLDVRVNLRKLAEEISRVAAADGFQPLEVHRVLALEDVVERLRDHGHTPLDLRIANAQKFLNLKVGGDAQLVEIDELLLDGLHRVLGFGLRDVIAHG